MAKQMTVESDFSQETVNRTKDKSPPEVAEKIVSYQKEILRLKMLVRLLLSRESRIIGETFTTNDEESLALRVQKKILSLEAESAEAGPI